MTTPRTREQDFTVRVAILLAIALALRCLYPTKDSFWLDEIVTWCFVESLHRAFSPELQNPPLYFVLLYGWSGFSDWARPPSAALISRRVCLTCGGCTGSEAECFPARWRSWPRFTCATVRRAGGFEKGS